MTHLFFFILMALPLAAQAIVIDNGIPVGTVNHWSVDVQTGGAVDTAVFTIQRFNSPDIVTENVVSSYRIFVDPGINGQGFELRGSEPQRDIFNSNVVVSSGTFIGTNGNTISWTANSGTSPGRQFVTARHSFVSVTDEPIGPLRIFQYLDGDVQGSDDDFVWVTDGSVLAPAILSTLDNIELYGVRQYGYSTGNLTFIGRAADGFDRIREQIAGPGQPVSTTSTTINLPTFQHPILRSVVHGPANVVSVVAWDVNPGARGAFIDTALEGVAAPPSSIIPHDEGCTIEEEGDTCEGPVVPVRRQFSCQGTSCKIAIACNLTTECTSKVELFVTPPPSTRLSDRATEVPRRVRFASVVANIPPGATAIVRPKLTKRGKAIFRANRKKRIRGVMQITNSATGNVVTFVPVRIKLR